jgi:hypothetical protein
VQQRATDPINLHLPQAPRDLLYAIVSATAALPAGSARLLPDAWALVVAASAASPRARAYAIKGNGIIAVVDDCTGDVRDVAQRYRIINGFLAQFAPAAGFIVPPPGDRP